MIKPQAPCLDCKDRTVEDEEKGTKDCHPFCPEYCKYTFENEEYQKKIRARKKQESLRSEYVADRLRKRKQK